MPRKPSKPKRKGAVITVAESLAEAHPELVEAAEDYKAPPAPDVELHLEPLPPAVEQAADPEQPNGRYKSWTQTVRPWHSHDSGIKHVTFKAPMGEHGQAEFTGLKFPDDKPATTDEKLLMQEHGMGYWKEAKAWGIRRNPDNEIVAQGLAEQIAEGRRQERAR